MQRPRPSSDAQYLPVIFSSRAFTATGIFPFAQIAWYPQCKSSSTRAAPSTRMTGRR
eukprot:gene26870-biopygen23114